MIDKVQSMHIKNLSHWTNMRTPEQTIFSLLILLFLPSTAHSRVLIALTDRVRAQRLNYCTNVSPYYLPVGTADPRLLQLTVFPLESRTDWRSVRHHQLAVVAYNNEIWLFNERTLEK